MDDVFVAAGPEIFSHRVIATGKIPSTGPLPLTEKGLRSVWGPKMPAKDARDLAARLSTGESLNVLLREEKRVTVLREAMANRYVPAEETVESFVLLAKGSDASSEAWRLAFLRALESGSYSAMESLGCVSHLQFHHWLDAAESGVSPEQVADRAEAPFAKPATVKVQGVSAEDLGVYLRFASAAGAPVAALEFPKDGVSDDVIRAVHSAVSLAAQKGQLGKVWKTFFEGTNWKDIRFHKRAADLGLPRVKVESVWLRRNLILWSEVQPLSYEDLSTYEVDVLLPAYALMPEPGIVLKCIEGWRSTASVMWEGNEVEVFRDVVQNYDVPRLVDWILLGPDRLGVPTSVLAEVKGKFLELLYGHWRRIGLWDASVQFRALQKWALPDVEAEFLTLLEKHFRASTSPDSVLAGLRWGGEVGETARRVAAELASTGKFTPLEFATVGECDTTVAPRELLEYIAGDPQACAQIQWAPYSERNWFNKVDLSREAWSEKVIPTFLRSSAEATADLTLIGLARILGEGGPDLAYHSLETGVLAGGLLRRALTIREWAKAVAGYTEQRIGTNPRRWALFESLMDGWEGDLPTVLDTVKTLEQ